MVFCIKRIKNWQNVILDTFFPILSKENGNLDKENGNLNKEIRNLDKENEILDKEIRNLNKELQKRCQE